VCHRRLSGSRPGCNAMRRCRGRGFRWSRAGALAIDEKEVVGPVLTRELRRPADRHLGEAPARRRRRMRPHLRGESRDPPRSGVAAVVITGAAALDPKRCQSAAGPGLPFGPGPPPVPSVHGSARTSARTSSPNGRPARRRAPCASPKSWRNASALTAGREFGGKSSATNAARPHQLESALSDGERQGGPSMGEARHCRRRQQRIAGQ